MVALSSLLVIDMCVCTVSICSDNAFSASINCEVYVFTCLMCLLVSCPAQATSGPVETESAQPESNHDDEQEGERN